MILKLSSGRGPEECELAVGKLLDSLLKEFDDISLVESVEGIRKGTYKSVTIKCDKDISYIEGTVKWICNSPYRPTCKRKNWFVEIKVIKEIKKIDFDESKVEIETMRSPGKRGTERQQSGDWRTCRTRSNGNVYGVYSGAKSAQK